MLLLAAAEKLAATPWLVWVKFACVILGFVLAVILIRKIFAMSRLIVGAVVAVTCGIVVLNWAYHRNEPALFTPFMDAIAPLIPTGKNLEPPKLDPNNPNAPRR